MARKKNITETKIIELYMDQVLKNENLASVYQFAEHNNFEEQDFYKYFSSFDSLEKSIFAVFCSKTVELLHQNEDYAHYDSKTKLLSFYYTFFELLTANRSYVTLKLKANKNKLKSLAVLSKLRQEFIAFVTSEIPIDKMDFKNKTISKIQDKGTSESFWLHLLFTLQFWLEDESYEFEKTDLFIEKSIQASFDLQQLTPVKSVIDLAKFLWKEKAPTV